MSYPWIEVIALLAVELSYVLLPIVADAYGRCDKSRALRCPETGGNADVDLDISQADFTWAIGRPLLRAKSCSLWPERAQCGQDCLKIPEAKMPGPLHVRAL